MDPTFKTILLSCAAIVFTAMVAGVVTLYSRVRRLEEDAVKIATQIQPFWAVVQEKMVKDLTHPSAEFHEADELLARLKENALNTKERELLLRLMEQRVIDPNPKVGLSERETAGGLAFVMRKVQEEEASAAPIAEVQVVGIKKPDVGKESEDAAR